MRVLPFRLDSFDWNRFESFCLAVVRALPDVKRADRYGKVGEAQKGIDIEADLTDGRKRTIQCRHRKSFNKSHAEKTVAATSYEADEHEIWVTCQVGTNAGDYIDGLDDWTLESDEGISQRLRLKVPREKARLIVADAFGGSVSRAFLGPDGPVGFVSPEDFFAPFDEPGRLLRHDLALVGRETELRALVDAARTPSVRVVLLPGRGGIGKTRLLREAAQVLEEDGKRVLFVRDGGSLTAKVLEDLPLEDTAVFLEDVQRSDVGLAPLLAATRRADPLTIVLATRPAGLDRIVEACSHAGFDPDQRLELPRMGALAPDEVTLLAELAMGRRSVAADRLAEATRESPLITVLGGGLIARGAFDVNAVDGPAELRKAVMDRFVAELRGRVTQRVPERSAEELLVLLAALGPVNIEDGGLMDLVAEELGAPVSKLRRWLGDIQEAGLLLELGPRRRLTPDVLADQVLFDACVDRQGHPTGRALELWRRYAPSSASDLLVNLGAIDWRAGGASLLDEVWAEILEAFANRDAWGREQLIDLVGPAAEFAPDRMLELVDLALAEPATATDWDFVDVKVDDDSVRRKLPPLLLSVGRHRGHARAAMERLWTFGRDDPRPTHPHPDHPLRLLRELGSYRMSLEHRQALIDLVGSLVVAEDVDDYANSPLELLDELLSRDGMRTRMEGFELKISDYLVSTEKTERWRVQVRKLLVGQALRGSPRQRVVAAKLFEGALRLPFGAGAEVAGEDVMAEWHADKLRLLDAIEEIAEAEPMVRAALAKALRPHAEHDSHAASQERAASLLRGVEDDETWLLGAIAWPWEILDQTEAEARDLRIAAMLTDRCEDGRALGAFLEETLREIVERNLSDNPAVERPVQSLLQDSTAYAEGLWEWGRAHPDGLVAPLAWLALTALRENRGEVDAELDAAAKSDDAAVRRLAAQCLSSAAWARDPTVTETAAFERLAGDEDPQVRRLISTSLPRMGHVAPELAVRQALAAGAEEGGGRRCRYALPHGCRVRRGQARRRPTRCVVGPADRGRGAGLRCSPGFRRAREARCRAGGRPMARADTAGA